MLETLLIANRGEIARRIIRTARRLGIRTVAVFSDADAAMPFVREADAGDPHRPGAGAGKLSGRRENSGGGARHAARRRSIPAMASSPRMRISREAVIDAGLIWVGAPPAAIRAMGLQGCRQEADAGRRACR